MLDEDHVFVCVYVCGTAAVTAGSMMVVMVCAWFRNLHKYMYLCVPGSGPCILCVCVWDGGCDGGFDDGFEGLCLVLEIILCE